MEVSQVSNPTGLNRLFNKLLEASARSQKEGAEDPALDCRDEQSGGSGRDGTLGHGSRLPRLRFCRRRFCTFPFPPVFSTFSNIPCPAFLHHLIKHLTEGRSYWSVSVPSI